MSAPLGCGAVEIAAGIETQAAVGLAPVRAGGAKAIQYRLRPAPARCGRQLEHRTIAGEPTVAVGPTFGRGAVEIAGGVENQAGLGELPIWAPAEVIQYGLGPAPARCGRQLEHRPIGVSATA